MVVTFLLRKVLLKKIKFISWLLDDAEQLGFFVHIIIPWHTIIFLVGEIINHNEPLLEISDNIDSRQDLSSCGDMLVDVDKETSNKVNQVSNDNKDPLHNKGIT